jgi:lambda family phage portal protein
MHRLSLNSDRVTQAAKHDSMLAAAQQALRGNWIDRTITYFSPVRGAQRQKARAMIAFGSGYVGARWDRNATKTWNPINLAADETTLWDLFTLRGRSRDLVRNNAIGRGAIQTVVQNTVGSGLKLQANPDAEALKLSPDQAAALKKQIEREWRLFAESTDCDLTRKQDFYGLQALAFRSTLEGGDCFALLPMVKRPNAVYQTCLQLIEAERVANPQGESDNVNLRAGIEIDDNGTPKAYNIRKFHPYSTAGTTDQSSTKVLAFGPKTGRRNVLHMIEMERPGQSRGVPYLAPVIELLRQIDRYSEAELMAAVVSALFTVFVTSPDGNGISDTTNAAMDTLDAGGSRLGAVIGPNDVAMGSGSIVDLNPGEKPEFANPTRPNAAFDPFFQACVRQIGIALSIPFEVLIKHFTASYSAARAALLDAWTFFYNRRQFLTVTFCQPTYETWFEEAVAIGRIDAAGFFSDPAIRRAYLRAEWVGDAPVSLDPEKEANAAKVRLEIGVSTIEKETMQLTGGVWEDNHPQQVREQQLRKQDGLIQEAPPAQPADGSKKGNGKNANGGPEQGDQEAA